MQILRRSLYVVVLLFIAVNIKAAGYDIDIGQWMKEWTVCGPIPLQVVEETDLEQQHIPGFETDYLASIGGESNPQIVPGKSITINGNRCTFMDIVSADSIISLDEHVSKKDNVCAYAFRQVSAEQDLVCYLSLGCNDGGRFWLNGEEIWDRPEPGGVNPDEILLPVLLKKGKNTLLLKVEERGNVWEFCARFLPLDAEIQPGSYFEMFSNNAGDAVLRFKYNKSVMGLLFNETKFSVTLKNDPESLVWQGELEPVKERVLPVKSDIFEKYRLNFTARFTDGQAWQEIHDFSIGERQVYQLFNNHKSSYNIVIDEKSSDSEHWVAKELQHWLNRISGAFFPIVNDFKPEHPSIVVGFHPVVEKTYPGLMSKRDNMDESFIYKNMGPHILIQGGSQRGTMYGVFSFLENELGLRWYTPKVTVVPEKDAFEFDYLYNHESPGIRVRNDFYYEAFDPVWAARNRVNGAMGSRKQPGGVEGYWAVHTFYRFMPPEEFYDKHPEYYSLIDGKRVYDRAQLCLTNPDVLKIITKRLKQTMKENPDCLIYSVSQNDWRNPCQCENCQRIARQEESESGPLIWFVNKVAKEIEKDFPDKYVGTLAYQYTRKPCKTIKPRENVVIRLCSIECCFAHDFKSCPENRSFIDDLQGWSDIAPHMYIWDYVVNFSHYTLPYPNFAVLQENIKTFRENNSIGIMEQAAYQSRGGEFAELRAYVISKLLWNPDCDVKAVIDDFMYGYYGRSGQFVHEYFSLLQGLVTPLTHIHLGLKPEDKIFPDSFISAAGEVFDRAEAVSDNQDVLERVQMARLPVLYLKCLRYPLQSKQDGTYTKFCEIVEREGITHYAERGKPHKVAFHQLMENAD